MAHEKSASATRTVPARGKPLPGFSSPAVGFEEPFEMLHACHERVERTLNLLARLRAHVVQHGVDDGARQAARDVLRYFDIAAPLHHQDEELHVFPPLLAEGADPALQALALRLQDDHTHMAREWAAARAPLLAWSQGLPAPHPGDAEALDRFALRYTDHLAAEDTLAYPAARAALAARTLQAMGQEMAARRGSIPQAIK